MTKVTKSTNAFMQPLTPDAALAEIVGAKPLPRTEAVRRMWDYIKAHGLQDPTNRRVINADAKLRAVFGGKASITMFEVSRVLGNHLS
jgi:chromatin remodeling complex protein RSC6